MFSAARPSRLTSLLLMRIAARLDANANAVAFEQITLQNEGW
jgi:hypothetical protein